MEQFTLHDMIVVERPEPLTIEPRDSVLRTIDLVARHHMTAGSGVLGEARAFDRQLTLSDQLVNLAEREQDVRTHQIAQRLSRELRQRRYEVFSARLQACNRRLLKTTIYVGYQFPDRDEQFAVGMMQAIQLEPAQPDRLRSAALRLVVNAADGRLGIGPLQNATLLMSEPGLTLVK